MAGKRLGGGNQPRVNVVRDVVAIVFALRNGPSTMAELAAETGIGWRKVYRLVADLRDAGAPLRETGVAPKAYALTVAGMREWLG